MLPRKIFENLQTVVAILVVFEQFLGKFFAPKSDCFTKYDAFCSYIFDSLPTSGCVECFPQTRPELQLLD